MCFACCLPTARLCVLARRQGRSAQRVALGMSCVVAVVFMAMRAQTVGVDTKYYVCIYQQFPQISWKELFTAQLYPTPRRTWELDLEPGYRLLNKLLSIYLPAPQWITVANSALIIALLYRWLRRESPNAMLSIWLYLTLGVYQTEMNVARNAIAIYWVIRHSTGSRSENLRRTFANSDGSIVPQKCSGLSAAVLVGEPSVEISPCAVLYHGSLHFGRSISGCGGARGKFAALCASKIFYEEQQQNGIHCGWCVLCFAGCLCSLQNDTRGMQKAGIQGTAGTISHNGGTFTVRLNLGLASAARMAALFGPYLIVLLPRMLEYINCPRRRAATIQWLAVAAGLQYVLRLLINNIGGTMPYQFFWAA